MRAAGIAPGSRAWPEMRFPNRLARRRLLRTAGAAVGEFLRANVRSRSFEWPRILSEAEHASIRPRGKRRT